MIEFCAIGGERTLPGRRVRLERPYSEVFPGDGEMAQLMRATDWSRTPIGAPDTWPLSLRTVVRVLLTSKFAMWMGWGPDLLFFYNDSYKDMTLGAKHPWALARPSREVWAEIWTDIKPRIDRVMHSGQATWDEQLLLFLERSGYREETYHTFSYSPLTDDQGTVCGNFCVVTEETERVLAERRMALLRDTALAIATTITEGELFAAVERALRKSPDLPFTLVYLFDETENTARLVCRAGIPAGHPAAPPTLDMKAATNPWRLEWTPDGPPAVVDLSRFTDLPHGPWDQPPTQAFVLPVAQQGQKGMAGLLVAAVNPFRPADDATIAFVSLLVGQIASGLANVNAYEEERRRAQALAEIDRAKTAFFSNVSHEFRTPLTLLLGPLEDARQAIDGVPANVRAELDVAYRNAQRLLKLVNTLLDFSRIEAGRVRASFEPVDLCALTADLASTFRSAMERAGLEFVVDCAPLPEAVYVDREMWEKIILNLISNAFKFTLEGQVTVSVGEENGHVKVSVADTGVGIPEGELPRVFDRFHRVEGMRGRSHEGSGIGLALVQELVRLHGGELTATSTVDRGSTFTVSLPFGSSHLPSEHLAAPSHPAVATGAASYVEEALRWLPNTSDAPAVTTPSAAVEPAARVLLADDNSDMRDYARRLLSERWDVEAVRNGREAIEAARVRRPDVIVTDVMMPELDGFGLLRELRADPNLHDVPVIMLSARAGEEARIEGLAASADDYLVKPFSARDLLARVDAQVVKARMRRLEQAHARRLRQLFRHAPVAVAVLAGPDHVFELTNSGYQEMIGDRNVIGRSIRTALPELDGQGILEILDNVRLTGRPYVGRSVGVKLQRLSGGALEDRYFDFVYQPIPRDDGTTDSILVIAHDVTELAESKQEADAANRLKDEFLATLSHELRTPLNAVLGYIQMVRGGVIDRARLPSVLETIERNAKLQEQLISDVLDVSRIITGKLRLEIAPVDVSRVIRDALETVTPAATAKGVRLSSTIESPRVPVAGDAQRLQQVIWNLLSNAIKFTPRGGRVEVRLEQVNAQAQLTVSDTGEGIAPEFLPLLFQRFRQADSTFTRSHGGLGLGLAISRHLVEAHGGSIRAMSAGKGHGATFAVELPLMVQDAAAIDDQDAAFDIPVSTLQLPRLDGRHVLLVDDDADALQMACDALSAAGARVTTARTSTDALQALDQDRFDAAVLDIGLPATDGYDLLRAIRQRPQHRQGSIPAAALTAYARTVDRDRSLEAGFQLHLSKPIQPAELASAVIALCGGDDRDA